MENVMTKVTNLSKAIEMVQAGTEARTPKAEIIAKIVTDLNVSKANAFVYFTKATKALGITITKGEGKAAKAPKAKKSDQEIADDFFANAEAKLKAKANKVTELSPQKKAKKVAVIDKVIADLKPQSPFAALGV
jgi:hypothetical protein